MLAGSARVWLPAGSQAREGALALPIAVGLEGTAGEQHPAELSPQGLLAEEEGRRGQRLYPQCLVPARLPGCFSPPARNGDVEPVGAAEHPYPVPAIGMGGCGEAGTGSSSCPLETHDDAWHPEVPKKVSLRPSGMTSPPALSVPAAQMPPG